MKRAILALAAILAVAGNAYGDQTWTQNQHATNVATGQTYSLDGLGAPVSGKHSPLRLEDLTLCSGPLWINGTGLPFRCATIGNAASGADLQAPLAPADGTIVMPTSSTIRVGVVPGTSVTGTAGTIAWFNGSGQLASLTLAPEFAPIAGGTLAIAANGIANAKLAQAPALSFKVNATNATATPSDLACTGANQVPQDTGSALVCQQLNYSQLAGTPAAITSLNGDVGATGPGAATATIQPNVVTNAKAAQMAAMTVKANATNATANAADLVCSTTGTFLGNLTGTSVACQAVPWSTLSGTTNAIANTNLAQMPAASIKGNATGSTANAQDVVAGAANLVPVSSASGWGWSPVPAAATNGIVANWPIGSVRWFALDAINGNDANAGYSDTSPADAGTKAKRTLAAESSIIPSNGAGRLAQLYVGQGTYADDPAFLRQLVGYAFFGIEGTATQANAGSVAFDGSATTTDHFAGAITVPGLNAGGYNPTGSPTTLVIQMVVAGGGAPSLPAEPAAPVGWRIRFDIATATLALRGVVRPIAKVSGGDTVTAVTALPAAPTTSDKFYIEKAGVIFSASNPIISAPGTQDLSIVGIDFTGSTGLYVYSGRPVFGFCGANGFDVESPATVQTGRILHVAGASGAVTNVSVGGGLRNAGIQQNLSFGGGMYIFDPTYVAVGTVEILSPLLLAIADGTVFASGVSILGGGLSTQGVDAADSIGGLNSTTPMRVIGSGVYVGGTAGLLLRGTSLTLRFIDFANIGAHPAIQVLGEGHVYVASLLSGSAGNSDVGLDLTGALSSVVSLAAVPTVTGSLGDVRLCDGTIVTWTQAAAGIIDACGNSISSSTGWPLQVTTTGVKLPSLAGTGTRIATAAPDGTVGTMAPAGFLGDPGANGIVVRTAPGSTTSRTLTNTDGTVTITNPDGVAGNPIINTTGLAPAGNYITALTGDVTAAGPGVAAATLHNIPSATTQPGFVNATGISPPATPATGHGSLYYDLASQNLGVITEAGTYKHGVQTDSGSTNQFVTGITDTGFILKAQPTTGNLLGPTGGGNQCLQANNSGAVIGTGAPCGSGSGSITAVTASAPLASSGGTAPNITLGTSGVAAGTYVIGNGFFVVDAFGRLTSAGGATAYTASSVNGGGTVAGSQLNFNGPFSESIASGIASVTMNVGAGLTTSGNTLALATPAYRDYFIDIPSLQPADTASRWLATSSQTQIAAGGVIEYANTDYVVGHIAYAMDIVSSSGTATSMQCSATRNGSAIGGTTLIFTPGATPPGVYSISSAATGSASTGDTYGMACQYNGNFTTGPFGATIAFTVHMALSP